MASTEQIIKEARTRLKQNIILDERYRAQLRLLLQRPEFSKALIQQTSETGIILSSSLPKVDFSEKEMQIMFTFYQDLAIYYRDLATEGKPSDWTNLTGFLLDQLPKMGKIKQQSASEVVKQILRCSNDTGAYLGFLRKVQKRDLTKSKKACPTGDIIIRVMKQQFGKDVVVLDYDHSKLIDLETPEAKISPLIKQFLVCSIPAGCLDFLEKNPAFANIKCLNELMHHICRLVLLKQKKRAQLFNRHFILLFYSLMLKEFTRPYFERQTLFYFEKEVAAYFPFFEELCSDLERDYLNSFRYQFTIPDEAKEFIVSIPAPNEPTLALFQSLPARLRQALEIGTAVAVKHALEELSQEEREVAMRKCCIGELFFFNLPLPLDFGYMN